MLGPLKRCFLDQPLQRSEPSSNAAAHQTVAPQLRTSLMGPSSPFASDGSANCTLFFPPFEGREIIK